jgi:hypothetical protein
MPIKLSFDKFTKLLSQNGYIYPTIYYTISESNINHAIFFEIRLPKTQKSIIVHVNPAKYYIIVPDEVKSKLIKIVSVGENTFLTDKSISYLINVRGPLIDSDLAISSSEGICYSKFSGENVCYFLASTLAEKENALEDENLESVNDIEKDEITLLEKDVNKIANNENIKLNSKYLIEDSEPVENIIPKKPKNKVYIVDNPVEKIELIFEDTAPKTLVNEDDEETEFEDGEEPENEDEDNTSLKLAHRTNYVDPEELDVNLGIVYVAIDISYLYENITSYETEALSIYEQIDDNEHDILLQRVSLIKNNLQLAGEHLDLRIKEVLCEEKGLKYQLLRLTSILKDTEHMKTVALYNSMNSKSVTKPPSAASSEIDKIYTKTRRTIHDINVNLLRQRSEIDDLLANYEDGLKELFDL